ncbi:hypothetical protein CORC01_10822 [Colletotrichum orchidophilum]|uniref:Uncharacterized protein n=1 Tax=Colletotrichum orchidophilum TaxID=1209926 RepID=A0A1G4AXW5_9PEZI|nr:uncharacterized protein CORC01_10822 [Colletotrichum orchidophilum]OHE93923.1 hypothetical protein CORC01_10822 [Colletotrichum orchidophilum]
MWDKSREELLYRGTHLGVLDVQAMMKVGVWQLETVLYKDLLFFGAFSEQSWAKLGLPTIPRAELLDNAADERVGRSLVDRLFQRDGGVSRGWVIKKIVQDDGLRSRPGREGAGASGGSRAHQQRVPVACVGASRRAAPEHVQRRHTQVGNWALSPTIGIFQPCREVTFGEPHQREMYWYFANLFKNSNKGIKGRGKDRRVSNRGTKSRTAPSSYPANRVPWPASLAAYSSKRLPPTEQYMQQQQQHPHGYEVYDTDMDRSSSASSPRYDDVPVAYRVRMYQKSTHAMY